MISRQAFEDAAARIGCEPEAVIAVATVESNGGGFFPDGSPKTLFEGHWFYRYTKGRYAQQYPTICYPTWTKQFYGRTWSEETARFNTAASLDKTSAQLSASWGAFQIMGFNFPKCGYKTVQQFVNAMSESEDTQLEAFIGFIINAGLADELQECRWTDFARLYNGPEYARNQYDVKLTQAYNDAKNQ